MTDPNLDHDPEREFDAFDAVLLQELRQLERESFPTDRLSLVLTTARREARREAWAFLLAWLRSAASVDWKPALAMAALTAVTVTAALFGDPGRRAPAPVDPAVAQAIEDVRWTLAFLADVSRRTGSTVRLEVLEPHVVQPMQDAVLGVFDDQTLLN